MTFWLSTSCRAYIFQASIHANVKANTQSKAPTEVYKSRGVRLIGVL